MRLSSLLLFAIAVILAACSPYDEPGGAAIAIPASAEQKVAIDELALVAGQVVYVPAYSNIFYEKKQQTWDLAVTVAVHNADPTNTIIIRSVRYYDANGNEVTEYVSVPQSLPPLGTANFVLDRTDNRGGIGAKFIVEWAAESEALAPVIETVMISTTGTQGLGFTSSGKVISGSDLELSTGQTVYVPAYSDIFFTDAEQTWDLAVTLVIHNTDADRPITINAVRYYDTSGKLVTNYLEDAKELGPWSTYGTIVERSNRTGGVGANFIVEWSAEQGVSEPLIEAVMVSTAGTQGLGFTSPGRVTSQLP